MRFSILFNKLTKGKLEIYQENDYHKKNLETENRVTDFADRLGSATKNVFGKTSRQKLSTLMVCLRIQSKRRFLFLKKLDNFLSLPRPNKEQ